MKLNKSISSLLLILALTSILFPSLATAILRDTVIADAYVFSTAGWTCIPGNANTTYNYFTVGGVYTGIPYNWGGYESVARALYKLSTGAVAGDSKIFGDVHSNFAGVDCSGYVSTCWRSGRYTTSTIPNIATTINWSDLLRGDVTNKAASHVRLFDCYTTGTNQIMFYESTAGVKPCRVVYRVLSKDTSYTPLRYKKIEDGPVPVASFYATPTTGIAPVLVQFYDTSTNSPTSWTWNFGDGSTATTQHPAHLYVNPGTYTVTLIARNSNGASTATKSNYITVGMLPIANFYGTPTTGTAPLTVNFYDTSSGNPTGWNWSFGDGTTGTVRNPTHTYTAPGNYTVTLIATNQYGSGTVTKIGYINVLPPPILNFTSYGEFTTGSDTTRWYFEKYGDADSAGTLIVETTYEYIAIEQVPGQKGKLTQVFSVPSSGWYTAKAKVWTTITTVNQQQKVYLYLQELANDSSIIATGNLVIQPGTGYFINAWIPQEIEISFYTQSTLVGVQLVAINPINSGRDGALCCDYIRVSPGAPQPNLVIINNGFDAGTAGWIYQIYGDAVSSGIWSLASSTLRLVQNSGEKGKASYSFGFATTNRNTLVSVWVYSDASVMNATQKVYLYLYDFTADFGKIIDSGNAILQSGKWLPGQWRQLRFVFKSTSQYNTVQLVGINPGGNNSAGLYFDTLEIKQE
ncbi:MAG: PKD domain-containing protein [bacterium]|nr:PKD domain-containing protein [bacterium]